MCRKDHFVELILRVKIILKLTLKRKIIACELNFSHTGRRRLESCFKPIVNITKCLKKGKILLLFK